ncbi:MAG: DNA-protecting protein DprA [Rickettsiales bacterium]|nr:DNA-protecting protein DprA [Rickettsiales bacterium]
MKNKHLFYCLQLARSKNFGPKSFEAMLFKFGSPKKIIENIDEIPRVELVSDEEVWDEIEKVEKFGARFLTVMDDDYPVFLKEIPDCPIVLTVKGDLSLLTRRKLAIVGSRSASINSMNLVTNIAHELSDKGVVVVSGLARGIDLAAHKGSLKQGTIAVIAGGIDNIYPQENEDYFAKIAKRGLLISEQKFGSKPIGPNFVMRNRIISALSDVVLIAEGTLKSGSMSTARFAFEQGKRIYAIPGSMMDERFAGTNSLIKEKKADILSSVNDLLAEFDVDEINWEEEIKDVENDDILGFLGYEPTFMGDLLDNLQISVSDLNIRLSELELAGKIIINGDNVVLVK